MAIYLGNTKVNATAGTPVTASITVDQSYDATSTNAQSGTAVAEAIAEITVDQSYDATSTNAQSGIAVAEAIADLDATVSGTGAGKTLSTLSETDGKISATFQDISITKSQVSDFPTSMTPSSHVHGNITNTGDITSNVAIASGDRLVINDESDSHLNNSSITFGTSTTTFLSNKGTWATPAKGATATYGQKVNVSSSTSVSAGGTNLGKFTLGSGKHIIQAQVNFSGDTSQWNVAYFAGICTGNKWSSKVASQYVYSDHAVNLNVTYIASLSGNTDFYLFAGGGSKATVTGYVRDICLS